MATTTTLPSSSLHTSDIVSKDDCTVLIDKLLRGSGYEIFHSNNNNLEDFLESRFIQEGIEQSKASRMSRQGASLAKQFYPHQSPEVLRLNGLYAGYFFIADDLCSNEEGLRHFRRNLVRRTPQAKIFEGCAELLRNLDEEYLEYFSDQITTGFINQMSSTVLEYQAEGKFCHLKSSPRFPSYFRSMTGNAEGFLYLMIPRTICAAYDERMNIFIRAIPELVEFTNKANDIMSFYKESVCSDETHTYVYNRAEASGMSLLQCLNDMVDEVLNNIRLIRIIVAADAELSHLVNSYISGYMGFHVMEPRYRVSELRVPFLEG